jgi:alpha-tubulin suppressor-like RCC1 family protein
LISTPIKITFFENKTIKDVACHIAHHTLVLTEGNRLYICGSNYQGQLTLGDQVNRNTFQKVQVDLGRDDVLFITIGEANTFVVVGQSKKGWRLRNMFNFSDVDFIIE